MKARHARFGLGCLREADEVLRQFPAKRIFLVTGKHSYTLSGAEKGLAPILATREVERFTLSTYLPELDEVLRGVKNFKKGDFDLIIAVGGGAPMDIAKLIGIFSGQKESVQNLIANPSLFTNRKTPLVTIPTTSGSGAEATHFAVLYINKNKLSIAHPSILPDVAIVDPKLTLSLPPRIAESSGFDALAQGIESYWSVNATKESQKYAREAILLAYRSLADAVNKKEINACAALSKAAFLAGKAINISKTTAPHALSYGLTAHFGIPHGHAVALTLGEFLVHNAASKSLKVQGTIQEICVLLDAKNAEMARENLQNLMEKIGLERKLSLLGVKQSDFAFITENINFERLANHPRKVTPEIIGEILMRIA